MNIAFVDLKAQYKSIKADIDSAIASVIDESAFIKGKYVKHFEEAFAKIYGIKHVISCANGTDSLYIIMKMLGIGPGDEVITAANSWISSSETITQTGAKPVFIDVHPEFFSMDEGLLESKITPKTKAVIVVHLHGQMSAVDKIKVICDRHNIHLIEDCAQSHFSELNGIRAGLTGIAASFSFFPGKNLGAYGDAGCIVTQDDALADQCRMYANHGALQKHQHLMEGINSRMDGLQASILLAKLPYILEWTEQRQRIAAWYDQQLAGIDQIRLPKLRPGSQHSYHLYVICAPKREALKKSLEEKGIETLIHYPTPLPSLPAYQYLGHKPSDFPVSTHLQPLILSLPIYPELGEDKVKYIAESIRNFYREN